MHGICVLKATHYKSNDLLRYCNGEKSVFNDKPHVMGNVDFINSEISCSMYL
jgi:hypothetical protein